jgi:predicted transcriptional regulator
MKNVTLAIDEDLLERARSLAAERHTTLNAMVRSLLAQEVAQDARIAWAREGMRELMERSTLEFEPGTNVKELSRSDVPVELHGHQHSDLGRRRKTR